MFPAGHGYLALRLESLGTKHMSKAKKILRDFDFDQRILIFDKIPKKCQVKLFDMRVWDFSVEPVLEYWDLIIIVLDGRKDC